MQNNETIFIINNLSWEAIKQAINDCEAESIFQAHSREVSVTLKNGNKTSAIEPRIDDIMDVAIAASPKCGRIIMGTE